ncbi:hypothetical protein EP331_01845 [bacterium]|nr:MAG: hypothetical protein EP331_01845 [bacterium]
MKKKVLFVFVTIWSFNNLFAQDVTTISVETGGFYSFGLYNNSVINIGDYIDPIYFVVGYQKWTPMLNYTVRLGLMEDNLADEFMGSLDPNSTFFGWRSWSPRGRKTVLLEIQASVNWLNKQNKIFPIIDLGISTLFRAQKVGGGSSIGDGQSDYQIQGTYTYERAVTPFLIAGFQYKLFDNPSYALPIRFGYRVPLLSASSKANWVIIDRIKNVTQYEHGQKTGFATYFTIGLEFKL